jgi:hypothetical protein
MCGALLEQILHDDEQEFSTEGGDVMTKNLECEVVATTCDRAEEQLDQIRRRAYELYEARGQEGGHDVEDWLQAEAEIIAGNHADSSAV